jgi:hypothetical protein
MLNSIITPGYSAVNSRAYDRVRRSLRGYIAAQYAWAELGFRPTVRPNRRTRLAACPVCLRPLPATGRCEDCHRTWR